MNAILQSVLIFSLCCPILCPLYINAKIPAIQKKGEKAIQIRVSTFVVGEIEVAPFDLPCGGTYAHAMQAIDSIGEGWRLPSVEEMKLIFEHKDKIGGFTVHYYWTSETHGDKATHFGFVLGDITAVPKHHGKRIRLVRTK
jgi:hypothetical protein